MNNIARRILEALGVLNPPAAPRTLVTAPGGATYAGIPRMPAVFGRQPGPRQRPDRDRDRDRDRNRDRNRNRDTTPTRAPR